MIGIGVRLWSLIYGDAPPSGGDTTPGGTVDVLTDDNLTVGLLDDDGSTFLRDD